MIRKVKTENGWVRGLPAADPRITSYKGIPYADKPLGENRWRAPQPCPDWDGELFAAGFAPAALQGNAAFNEELVYSREWSVDKEEPMSEDCLYLNVWAPADGRKDMPVYFWIYGGGLQTGFTAEMEFDGERIARRGIVVVTVGYRLNAFGFLCHPEITAESPDAPGNFGLLDQQFALRWVRRNIAAFGGDPDNITIFGCSGGGRSVQGIACSPLARGLVRHAICHSAGGLNPNYSLEYRQLKALGEEFAAYCGKKGPEEMRSIPAEELQRLYQAFRKQFNITGDGYVLPVEMDEMVRRGEQADLDYILSTTANEFFFPQKDPVTPENFRSKLFGNRTAIFGMTVKPETDEQARHYAECAEVYEMKSAQLAWAQLQASQGKKPAYVASFDHPNPATGRASHGDDQFYVFHTLRKFWFPTGQEEDELSRAMMLRWTNFAKTGDPNAEGLPVWTPFTAESPLTLSIRTAQDSAMEDRTLPEMEALARVYRLWPCGPEKE